MALVFPPSPLNGQTYTSPDTAAIYVYSTAVGAWLIQLGPAGPSEIPAGAISVATQPSAPVGWVQVSDTKYNDASIRLVTGAGGGSGGTKTFITLFSPTSTYTGAITITSGQVGGTTLSENQLPSHQHLVTNINTCGGSGTGMGGSIENGRGARQSNPAGLNGAHSHSLVGVGATGNFVTDFALKYVNTIAVRKS
jgi:hypothetical protein